MILKHKQTEKFGCGLYAIANLFHLDNYITDERLEISKKGLQNIGKTIELMAAAEGLNAHKNAVSLRLKSLENGI